MVIVRELGRMIWMANRMKTECFVVVAHDHLFKIFHPTQPIMISHKNCSYKVVEGSGATWVADGTENEFLVVVCILLKIL